MKPSLTISHLYPDEMNIYGDYGNILSIKNRLEARKIGYKYAKIDMNTKKFEPADIYFMGGGQDNDMFKVYEDLISFKKDFLTQEVKNNKVFLLICGGFQLFGKYFLDSSGRQINGLNILPIETKAPSNILKDRCLGNLAAKPSKKLSDLFKKFNIINSSKYLVGFENHSGQTYSTTTKFSYTGDVVVGKGNNSKQMIEGYIYKNVFGSYMHGSFLPKNPAVADLLISIALFNKYKKKIQLEALDDSIEIQANTLFAKKLSLS